MTNNKAVVSFANSAGYYMQRLSRLSDSLRNNFDGDLMAFVGEQSCGAPLHSDNPYAFKIYAFEKAIEAGYTKILWLDSSCFAIKNIETAFSRINEMGFIFQDSGHWLGTWASDKQLKYFGINRDDAMNMRMVGNAGFLGFDWDRLECKQFFAEWSNAMKAGMFKGSWTNTDNSESTDQRCHGSRHDMTCSSAIIHKMGLADLMVSGEQYLQYAGVYDEVLNDTIIIKAQG